MQKKRRDWDLNPDAREGQAYLPIPGLHSLKICAIPD